MGSLPRTLRFAFDRETWLRRRASAPEAQRLVLDLLKQSQKTTASRRVERILDLLVTAEECRTAILRDGLKGGVNYDGAEMISDDVEVVHSPLKGFHCALPFHRFADSTIEERNLHYRDVLRELQTLLMRYQWRPTVRDRLYRSLDQLLLWDRTKDANTVENRAVQFLLEQIDSHRGPARILRFRKCRECRGWFYALTDHQS